ncbi:PREDICTED: transmembrane protein 19 isoform X1 [Polistes canadensis]|uniref:transmembrane protein 19 isoform X1 n=2 Tax=Polistes canadensis TaxID=91411 RepID=UPI000718CA4B|nr:PREDICTED: transmembrane protein 19 isoform X1 [Polistes canadensis]XP_014605959.1 PREDICTED: transmembrane protein 19 isoform X1 [Polistes canadensis]
MTDLWNIYTPIHIYIYTHVCFFQKQFGMVLRRGNKIKNFNFFLPILISACAIPTSMMFWSINVLYSTLSSDTDNYNNEEFSQMIPPWRWLAAVIIPLLFMFWGLRKKSMNLNGALAGMVVGFILTLTNLCHLISLATFFVTGSKATKFRSNIKKNQERDFKEGGQRSWAHVVCNAGVATHLALLYLLDVGCGERPIDFDKYYRSSWLSIGILASFACCNGDTWASEFGTVIGTGDPFLITTRKRVPRGTNGGVSWFGLLFSTLGGLIVGLTSYLTILYTVDTVALESAAPQWPVIVICGMAGLIGSLIDSILGATLQYTGIDEEGFIVAKPGKGVKHISGKQLLDNHCVNLVSTIIIALTLPKVANLIWP